MASTAPIFNVSGDHQHYFTCDKNDANAILAKIDEFVTNTDNSAVLNKIDEFVTNIDALHKTDIKSLAFKSEISYLIKLYVSYFNIAAFAGKNLTDRVQLRKSLSEERYSLLNKLLRITKQLFLNFRKNPNVIYHTITENRLIMQVSFSFLSKFSDTDTNNLLEPYQHYYPFFEETGRHFINVSSSLYNAIGEFQSQNAARALEYLHSYYIALLPLITKRERSPSLLTEADPNNKQSVSYIENPLIKYLLITSLLNITEEAKTVFTKAKQHEDQIKKIITLLEKESPKRVTLANPRTPKKGKLIFFDTPKSKSHISIPDLGSEKENAPKPLPDLSIIDLSN